MGNAFGFGSHLEVEHESYASRMASAMCGVCIGIILVIAAIPILGWNEFNYVRNEGIIIKVSQDVLEAQCSPEAGNTGKAVHLSCPVSQLYDLAKDPRVQTHAGLFQDKNLLGVSIKAEGLIKQWIEKEDCTKKKDAVGGGTTKTCYYSYELKFVPEPKSSSNFHCPDRTGDQNCRYPFGITHGNARAELQNSGSLPDFAKLNVRAPENSVKIGGDKKKGVIGYGLNTDLASALSGERLLPLNANAAGVPAGARFSGQHLTIPGGKAHGVGDVQVKMYLQGGNSIDTKLSVIAEQGPSSTLVPWDTGLKGTMNPVNWGEAGDLSVSDMVGRKRGENSMLVWIIRAVGWFVMFLGLQMICGPVALMPDIIPCIGPMIGDVVGCALCYVNFFVSAALSLVVIAIAWCLARPLIGGIMLAVAVLLICGACGLLRSFKGAASESKPIMQAGATESGAAYGAAVQPAYGAQPVMATAQPVMAQPAPCVMSIQCPFESGPGQLIQVTHPTTGAPMQIMVPDGVTPGMMFQAQF